MSQHDDLVRRLGEAGNQPVRDDLRSDHLHQMAAAAVPTPGRQKRFGRLAVAAAAVVGFAFGSTGLAMAGALPGPAQGAAHDVLSVVQVNVPDRGGPPQRILDDPCKGPPPWALEDREPAEGEEQAHATTRRNCPRDKGRPDGVGRPDDAGRPDGVGRPDGHPHDGDECKGPPPWAGRDGDRSLTQDQKADLEAKRADPAQCPPEGDEDPAE